MSNSPEAQDEYSEMFLYNQEINKELKHIIEPLRDRYQINYFYYVKYIHDKIFIISTDLNFLGKVIAVKKSENARFVLLRDTSKLKMNIQRKMIWHGNPRDEYHDILYNFDIWNGYATIQLVKDGLEHWGFATSRANEQVVDSYLNESDVFKSFMLYLRDKAPHLINVSRFKRLPRSNVVLLKAQEENLERAGDPFLGQNINRFYFNDKEYLTRREVECLTGIIQFKSAKEIGKALGLSSRTVQKHLENIKSRHAGSSDKNLFQSILSMDSINYLFLNDVLQQVRSEYQEDDKL